VSDRRQQLFAFGVLLLGCSPKTAAVSLAAEAQRGSLVFTGSFYGEIEARQSIAIYCPDLTGVRTLTVDRVMADGAKVKKGDIHAHANFSADGQYVVFASATDGSPNVYIVKTRR
jgi:hypothetical protein